MNGHWIFAQEGIPHHQDLIDEMEELNKYKVHYRFLTMYYKSKYPDGDAGSYVYRIKKFLKWVNK